MPAGGSQMFFRVFVQKCFAKFLEKYLHEALFFEKELQCRFFLRVSHPCYYF